MSIEKMAMINVIGLMDNIDVVTKDMILTENIEIINSAQDINKFNSESILKTIDKDDDYSSVLKKIETLSDIYEEDFNINHKYIDSPCEFNECSCKLDNLYDIFIKPNKKLNELQRNIERIESLYKNCVYIKELDIDIEFLKNLKFFTYKFGILSSEDKLKLKRNYENINALVLHTGTSDKDDVYLVICPKELEIETDRILRSLNFRKIHFPKEFSGTPSDIVKKLVVRQGILKREYDILNDELLKLKRKYKESIEECYSIIKLRQKINELTSNMISSNNFFCISGWVPLRNIKSVLSKLESKSDLIITFKENDAKDDKVPPTKLKNNILFSPFEYLVKMYGIPSYNEIDPTPFLSIVYMFLFGAMFGDLGQGFVLFLGGILLNKKSSIFGGLLIRLGISSMIFGVFYGSVFGFEHVIDALVIKPFENINVILLSALIIGVILLLIGYVFSIINSIKQHNLKEGLFGRNGISGLFFYITLIILVVSKSLNLTILPIYLAVFILILLGTLMIVKEPLSNYLLNKRPLYHESPSTYYIESGFDMLETLLNMLSGTVSFIRVGAFALTHVGFFLAFESIAKLIGNPFMSVIILVLGNVIIIGLEGLIVFIQGLRLQYYELFSKYYSGEGKEFDPIKLND